MEPPDTPERPEAMLVHMRSGTYIDRHTNERVTVSWTVGELLKANGERSGTETLLGPKIELRRVPVNAAEP